MECGNLGGRPKKSKENQEETKTKPNDNQSKTEAKPNDKQTKAYMNNELCIMSNELCNNPPVVPPEGDGAELAQKEPKVTGFEEFWQSYPHKVGKKAALSAWKKLKPNAGLRAKIMEYLETPNSSPHSRRESGRYIPNPSTWLNQGRWDDQLDQVNTSKGGTSYEPDFSKWELPD